MKFTRPELLELARRMADEELDIMQCKNADYTADPDGSGDPFANFRVSTVAGVDPCKGVLVRVLDKMQRLKCFIEHGALSVKDESAYDAISDIRNYMILLRGMLEERASETP